MDRVPTPAPSQIALAMAIVKHKPAEQDIKEYILRIRRHIKSTKENHHSYPQEKFFDSVSFWQKAYEKSEAEQSKLLDRIFELERRNEALTAKLHGQETDSGKDQGPSKRKTPAGKNPIGARKRAKTQVNTGDLTALDSNFGVGDGAGGRFEYIEEGTAPFMRQFYALRKALQRRRDNGEIARCAVILCKTVASEMSRLSVQKITAIDHSKKVSLQTEQPDIPAMMNSFGGAYQLLCQALKKLPQTIPESGMVVYHIVLLYDSTLSALQEECKATTNQTPSDTTTRVKKSKPAKGAKLKQPAPSRSTGIKLNPDSELVMQFTFLLNTMVIALDVACARHQSLLEGFLFVLLSRAGELLSNFVFQDLQLRPDFYANPVKLPLPAGIHGVDVNDQSQCAAELEAKHVIWLLERTLALVNTSRNPGSTQVSQNGSDSRILTQGVRKQLQSTLLQAVFGESPKWKNALQAVSQPDQEGLDRLLNHPQNPGQTTPDWFIQEIWRLLGWEMLERKMPRADAIC